MSSTRPAAEPFPIVRWLGSRPRWQWRVVGALTTLAALFLALRLVTSTMLDRWWFDTVTDAPVWSTKVGAQLLLAAVATIVSAVLLVGSAAVALRTQPAPGNTPNRLVRRYRERMGPAHGIVLVGFAIYVTLGIGYAAMSQWRDWLLFLHAPTLGQSAPDVGWDLGYHLFRLPLLSTAVAWLRQLLLVAAGFAIAGYLANGAIKIPRGGRRSSPRVAVHLSLLAASYAGVQAFQYVFVAEPSLATNRVGAFDGPGYTQIAVVKPALLALAAIAVAVALLALWSASTRRWPRWMLATFALWGLLHVLLLGAVPAIVQRLVVQPAEAARELPSIAHNLAATRAAYGLDRVELVTETYADGLEGELPAQAADDLARMPLFTEDQLIAPLQVLEGTTATRISDVDLDRYLIDGQLRPVLIATRNANAADIPERGWVQRRLVYTHGDGLVAIPADTTSPDGRPDISALATALTPERPQLYFGEGVQGWYAIVGTRRAEVGGTAFDADTGIALSSTWRRLALALTAREVEPLVSAELTADSQLLYRRGLKERLGYLAPFLAFDGNAYPVVADGRVTWVIDGYTTSATFPYAQFANKTGLPGSSDLSKRGFNYVRASVKATVDAYDGTVHLYRTELGGADDPVLDAWTRIFPGLIEPIANMPATVREHLLYPQDLLILQTTMLGRYHVTDAETLFNGSDSWAVSATAGAGVSRGGEKPTNIPPSDPVSEFMAGAGDLGGHWVAVRPYGPGSATNPTSTRDVLTGLAIADHDNPERLRLIRFQRQPGQPVSSPLVAQSAIDTDRQLASVFTLLNANGSAVQFGPMTPVPLGGGLVWARSIIVTGTATTTTPRLYGIAVVSNGLVGVADTVEAALAAAAPPVG